MSASWHLQTRNGGPQAGRLWGEVLILLLPVGPKPWRDRAILGLLRVPVDPIKTYMEPVDTTPKLIAVHTDPH